MCRCKEREREVEELEQQLQAERMSKEEDQSCPEDEVQEQRDDESKDLQGMVDEEGRRSANAELQVKRINLFVIT